MKVLISGSYTERGTRNTGRSVGRHRRSSAPEITGSPAERGICRLPRGPAWFPSSGARIILKHWGGSIIKHGSCPGTKPHWECFLSLLESDPPLRLCDALHITCGRLLSRLHATASGSIRKSFVKTLPINRPESHLQTYPLLQLGDESTGLREKHTRRHPAGYRNHEWEAKICSSMKRPRRKKPGGKNR